MRAILILCCLASWLSACEESPQPLPQPSPVAPAPPPPPPPPDPPPGTRLIVAGEEIRDTVLDQDKRYAVNVTSAGTLTVHLSWADPAGSCYLLRFDIDGRRVESRSYVECGPSCLNHLDWHGAVAAAQQVQIIVVPEGYCWDINFESVDFALTTTLR